MGLGMTSALVMFPKMRWSWPEKMRMRARFLQGFDICLSTNTITLSETGTLVERMEELALMRALMQTGTLSIDGSGFARGAS
ncbi:MAG: hypothetical protein ACLU0O_08955 [Collinsella sp.]